MAANGTMTKRTRQLPFLENAPVPKGDRKRPTTRRRFLKTLGAAALGAAGVYGYAFRYAPYNPVVSRWRFELKGLPAAFRGLTIVQVTDLHHSEIVPLSYLESCMETVNTLDPDLVFLTGDYVTMDRAVGREATARLYLEPLEALFRGIRSRMGVFAVMGNHDVAAAYHATEALMDRAGVPLLQDSRLYLERGGERLALVGLRDFGTQRVDLDRAFRGLPTDEPALVLMHNPDLFPAIREHRNGLILAGHTHGGQVRLPFYGPVPQYIPSQYGNRFAEGVFRKGDLAMLVNRGLGMIRTPVRFNCRPEIAEITLEG